MTWSGAHFVVAGNRRFESVRGLGSLGIGLKRQHYAGLEDGRLMQSADTLGKVALELAERHELASIVSFGPDGFDGHTDHQATYYAAAETGLPHYIRTAAVHETAYMVQGDPAMKLTAMAHHASQYDLSAPGFWDSMDIYVHQLHTEHYALAAVKT